MNAESAMLMVMILLTLHSVFMVSNMSSIHHLINLGYTIIFNDNIQIILSCGYVFNLF